MAKLSGGILGTISGKVAGVVAGQWKDKNYVRQYAIPANPNTARQQIQRSKFQYAVAFSKLIVGQVLNVFVDPFQKSMSGFNFFIKQNVAKFVSDAVPSGLALTFGKLYMGAAGEPVASGVNLLCPFATENGVNGSPLDSVSALAIETDELGVLLRAWYPPAPVARSMGAINIPWGATLENRYVRVYVWAASRDTNGVLLSVSNSQENGGTIVP